MTGANQTTLHITRAKLFKSRKELVVLAVAAAVFAIVIYKVYLAKDQQPAATTKLPVVAADTPVSTDTPTTVSVRRLIAKLQVNDISNRRETEAPPKPTSDPFTMSQTMHHQLYRTTEPSVDRERPSEPVTLPAQNYRAVLARIPGAEEAAGKGLRLVAVMVTSGWKGAAVNGEVIQLGESVLGFKLVKVLDQAVILERGKHRIRLVVRSANSPGQGGQNTRKRLWRTHK